MPCNADEYCVCEKPAGFAVANKKYPWHNRTSQTLDFTVFFCVRFKFPDQFVVIRVVNFILKALKPYIFRVFPTIYKCCPSRQTVFLSLLT